MRSEAVKIEQSCIGNSDGTAAENSSLRIMGSKVEIFVIRDRQRLIDLSQHSMDHDDNP